MNVVVLLREVFLLEEKALCCFPRNDRIEFLVGYIKKSWDNQSRVSGGICTTIYEDLFNLAG